MRSRYGICLLLAAFIMRAEDSLTGAGATFPAPLYQKWISTFSEKFPSVKISYRSVGSSAGIDALRRGEIDFAASDAPVSDDELAQFPKKIRHVPAVIGAVVPIYHLEGQVRDLRFTPEILAGIYLGKIKRWDDPLLKSANRGVTLPSHDIAVVRRADGSGTTYIWTEYLAKVSTEWRSSIGAAREVHWPVGVAANGNEGMTELVAKTPDAIGYVEYIYAVESHLSYGAVRNAAGRFVQADLNSLTAAAATFKPAAARDFRSSITNAAGAQAYPIAAFTYFLIPEKFADTAKAQSMMDFLRWMLTFGQKESAGLGYAALPDALAKQALESIGGLR
jgi:phosphate transport system substrate-binding protein